MANASHKHFGAGSQGKGDGSGANSEVDPEKVGENMVLSNRDKSLHSDARGLDSKAIQTEQLHDHAANRIKDE
jgi:hypothetical protein